MDETREQKIHAHVQYLTTHLEEEMKKSGGLMIFGLPTPKDDIEREAVQIFAKLIEEVTGKKVKFTTPPGRA